MTQRMAWIAAAIGFTFTLWAFYPGYLSQDSAAQYLQARTGKFDTQHPPLMAMIWRRTNPIIEGPGGIFCLFALAYWSGLALVAAHAIERPWMQALAVLIVGGWPPMIGLLAHVWKDVGLMAMFLLASGLLAREHRQPSRTLLVLAFIAITLGAAFRHNGVFAALPFLPYLAIRWQSRTRAKTIVIAVIGTIFVIVATKAPDYAPHVERRSMWPTVALWDLAAVSVDERRIVIPKSVLRPGLTLEDLDSKFVAFTNTSTFSTDKIRLSLWEPYTAAQSRDLLEAWVSLPFEHTAAYVRHRWRLTRLLFGWGTSGRPSFLILQPEYQQLDDNPPVVPNRSKLNYLTVGALLLLDSTPIFGGWLYLTLAVLVFAASLRRIFALAATIAASGFCYAVPLTVLSGASDFRYLSWLVAASLVAALLRAGKGSATQKRLNFAHAQAP